MCDHLGRHDASAANDGDSEETTVDNGHSCTIVGTSGDDRVGGDGPAGSADNSSDTIHGGPGNDVLDGGNGDDTLVDTEGTDTLRGGNGDDTIVTADGAGGDTADGGLGTDTCTIDATDTRISC